MKNILSVFTFTLLITNAASATTQPAPAVNPTSGHGSAAPAAPSTEGAPAAYNIQGEAIHKMATMMGSCGVENARALRNDPGQLTYKIKEGLWEGMYLYHSRGSQEPIMEEPTAKDILAKRFTKPDGTAYASYNDLPEDLKKAVANLATVFVKNFKSLTTEDAKNKKVDTQYEESKDPREQYRKYLSVINGVLRDDSADGALIHGAETALANWLEKCSSNNEKPEGFTAALGEAAKVAETEKKASEDFKGKVAGSTLAKRAEAEKNLAPEKQFATKKLAAMEKLHADYQKVKNDPNATPEQKNAAEVAYKKGLVDLKKGSSPDAVKDIDALLAKDNLGAGQSIAAAPVAPAAADAVTLKRAAETVFKGDPRFLSVDENGVTQDSFDKDALTLKPLDQIKAEDLTALVDERAEIETKQSEAKKELDKLTAELGNKNLSEGQRTALVEKVASQNKAVEDLRKLHDQNRLLEQQVVARESESFKNESTRMKIDPSVSLLNAPGRLVEAKSTRDTAQAAIEKAGFKREDLIGKDGSRKDLSTMKTSWTNRNLIKDFYAAEDALRLAEADKSKADEMSKRTQAGRDEIRFKAYQSGSAPSEASELSDSTRGVITDGFKKFADTPPLDLMSEHAVARGLAQEQAKLATNDWKNSPYGAAFQAKPSAAVLSDYIFASYLDKAANVAKEKGEYGPSKVAEAAGVRADAHIRDIIANQGVPPNVDAIKKHDPVRYNRAISDLKNPNKKDKAIEALREMLVQYYLMSP